MLEYLDRFDLPHGTGDGRGLTGEGNGDGSLGSFGGLFSPEATGGGGYQFQINHRYPLDAVDLLTRLAAREALQPVTTTGEQHAIRKLQQQEHSTDTQL